MLQGSSHYSPFPLCSSAPTITGLGISESILLSIPLVFFCEDAAQEFSLSAFEPAGALGGGDEGAEEEEKSKREEKMVEVHYSTK